MICSTGVGGGWQYHSDRRRGFRDTYQLSGGISGSPDVVTDFATGAGGDQIDLTNVLNTSHQGFTPGDNPFADESCPADCSDGSDVLLQVDPDGDGTSPDWLDDPAPLCRTPRLMPSPTTISSRISPPTPAKASTPPWAMAARPLSGGSFADTVTGGAGDDLHLRPGMAATIDASTAAAGNEHH